MGLQLQPNLPRFNKLFKYIDEKNLQNKVILPVLKLLYNKYIEFSMGSISNFKRKVQRYFKWNEHDVEYLNFPALNLDASSHSSDSISLYCDKISLTKSLWLGNFDWFWRLFESFENMLHNTSPSYWMYDIMIISFRFCTFPWVTINFFEDILNQKLRPIRVTWSNRVTLIALGVTLIAFEVTLIGRWKLPKVLIKLI